jgi:hypothetical protein
MVKNFKRSEQNGLCFTPKIPCAFLPNFAVFDIVGKINFSKN